MNAKEKNRPEKANKTHIKRDLQLTFDMGHSSIGWGVLQTTASQISSIDVLGCGAVTFRADDCLASGRRTYRRQRRHIRSTRQRIQRMKALLAHLGVLKKEELDCPGCAWPWLLAARVLASKTGSNSALLLSWPELWDLLRWYAHNRGYDGNRGWSASGLDLDAEKDDTEKIQNAKSLMEKHGTTSMAATFCAVSGLDPLGSKRSCNLPADQRPKSLNAAFPREIVENEVRQVLQRHVGKLAGLNDNLVRALLEDWSAIPVPDIRLAKRYRGGLLFGQLVPRFDNRIISKCPITGEKVPTRDCPEFFKFRWAMQLANIQVGEETDRELRFLNVQERAAIDKEMRERGYLTAKEFKQAVRNASGCGRDNLDTMLMHPDAKDALLFDPVQKLVASPDIQPFWQLLPVRLQKRNRGKLRRRQSLSLAKLREQMLEIEVDTKAYDDAIQKYLDAANTKGRKKDKPLTREELLKRCFSVPKLSGRAAFARRLLQQAHEEVMAGKPHPKTEGGCLFLTEAVRNAQLNREITEQTNNHLVRHRLLILERLLGDIIKEYAGGDKERVARITIEVNRGLREMSGKTAKEKAQDLGSRIANHHAVATILATAFEGATFNSKPVQISAGLIRKARIADDLNWTCPYTGQTYEPIDLVTRRVDKDHIIPRSQRTADGLDSLVITFSQVNGMKGNRTAWQFIEQEQSKPVKDLPNLSIVSLSRFRQFVEGLESFRGHEDDKRRKKKRKELLLLPIYEEKEFLPRDLTQTSQVVRMGAQVLRRALSGCTTPPVIVSLPGSVTGEVRKAWNVLGCLSLARPEVLDESGKVKTKTEIRDITHLHHALDACVLGLASHFIPNNGRVWELIVKRKLTDEEKQELQALKVFGVDDEGRCRLSDLSQELKEQIRQRLAEKRVVQHVPARMDGLRVEQNTWRVVALQGQEAVLQQRIRATDGSRPAKTREEKLTKLLGINPGKGAGKLRSLKGALVIPENFGVALDPEPTIIPFHKVWNRLNEIRRANGGKTPRILRNGQIICVPRGRYKGVWRVFSVKATMTVDLGAPDKVRLENKGAGQKREVQLRTLLRDGMSLIENGFTGISAVSAVPSE